MDSTIHIILQALQQPVNLRNKMQKKTIEKLSGVLFDISDDLRTFDKAKIINVVNYYIFYYWNREDEREDISAIYRKEQKPIIQNIFSITEPSNDDVKRNRYEKQRIQHLFNELDAQRQHINSRSENHHNFPKMGLSIERNDKSNNISNEKVIEKLEQLKVSTEQMNKQISTMEYKFISLQMKESKQQFLNPIKQENTKKSQPSKGSSKSFMKK